MKIAVLLKQVPKYMEVQFKQDHTLDRERLVKIMNPADKCALFRALELKERIDGEVIALSMGILEAEEMLREAAAFGADRCVLLNDPAFAGADTFATAKVLARAVSLFSADLVLCGRHAIDGETGQVGPSIAAMLGIPCATNVSEFSLKGNGLILTRLLEDSTDTISLPLPAVVSVVPNLDINRLPSIIGLRRAKNVKILHMGREELSLMPEECGHLGSKTRVVRLFVSPSGRRKAKKIDDTNNGVEVLFALLKGSVVGN